MDDWNSGQPINQCIPFHVTDTLWMNLKQFLWWFKNRYANFFTLSQRVPTTRILLMVTIFNCAFLTIYCFNFTVRTYIESKICIPYQPWILCINGTIFQKIHFCQHAKTIKVGRKWDFLMLEPQFPSFFFRSRVDSPCATYQSCNRRKTSHQWKFHIVQAIQKFIPATRISR